MIKINWRNVGNVLFLIGWGITLHAVVDDLIKEGGLREVFTFQGEWFGLFFVMLGWLIYNWKFVFGNKDGKNK